MKIENSKENDFLVTHYFYFEHITDSSVVHLVHYYDRGRMYGSKTKKYAMKRIPNRKIFYNHMQVNKDKDDYKYAFSVKLTERDYFVETDVISRSVDKLVESNLTLFDTPPKIGRTWVHDRETLLKNYFKYYASRCDVVPQEYLEQLLSFYKTFVETRWTYDKPNVLRQNFMIK